MEKKSVFLRIVIGYACISSLGVTGYLGFYKGEWFLVLCAIEVLLHVALLAVGIWLAVRALRKEPPRKKGVRAGMLAGGLAIIFFLTCFGGVRSFQTDANTPAALEATRTFFDEYCEEKDFSGAGVIFDDLHAEVRTARAWRLPDDETRAQRVFRRLSGDFWMGYGALCTRAPFLVRSVNLADGYALLTPVVALRAGTVPAGDEYRGCVFLRGKSGNYCIAYTLHSDFRLAYLFCGGTVERDLNALCSRLTDDRGSFYLAPVNDPLLERLK